MADQQQLDLLQQGVDSWKKWRKKHPEVHIDLSYANLSGADLSGTNLTYADLTNINLIDADLSYADLSYTDLSGADLSGADLSFAYLNGVDLSGAILHGTDLSEATLSEVDFSGATLTNSDLSGATLSNVIFREAKLTYTNISYVELAHVNLSKATIGRTTFGDVDLRNVNGLETIVHWGPSTIGTNTISRSEGDIPDVFLREAGLTDAFITYARSLAQNPIEYDTCFISYSSKDQAFAERLYTDLQSKGVRCWFAPEDMKTGEKIRHRIDESIRLYDKLLLVLSEHSIASSWVEHEVEMALAKEQKVKRTVLFPIRLDTAIMNMEQDGWPAEVRHTRHITDFTHWKQHDDYQKSLSRLLRDLQPDMAPKKAQ